MAEYNRYAGNNAELGQFVPAAQLFALKPWRSALALLADWLLIAFAFVAAIRFPHMPVDVIAAILIARSQLALAVMMHDAAHGLLAHRPHLNDVLGQAFAAGPLGVSLKTYRAGHLKHHRAPMHNDDPVAVVFNVADYPITRQQLVMRLCAYLCGIGYCRSLFKLLQGDYRHLLPKIARSPASFLWELLSILTGNALLLGLLALAGHPWLYVGLWLVPSMTLLPLFGQIRAIFEHAALPPCADQSRNARTIVRLSWQTFLFGPHAIHYHIEHHLFMRMPFYNLAAVHRQLMQRQLLPQANLYQGYGDVMRDVVVR